MPDAPDAVARVALAIRDAERCEGYTPDDGDACAGLDGCTACLDAAARAARRAALEEAATVCEAETPEAVLLAGGSSYCAAWAACQRHLAARLRALAGEGGS